MWQIVFKIHINLLAIMRAACGFVKMSRCDCFVFSLVKEIAKVFALARAQRPVE